MEEKKLKEFAAKTTLVIYTLAIIILPAWFIYEVAKGIFFLLNKLIDKI
jgi:hypothetical protein